jgi:hypothetical protein
MSQCMHQNVMQTVCGMSSIITLADMRVAVMKHAVHGSVTIRPLIVLQVSTPLNTTYYTGLPYKYAHSIIKLQMYV